MLPALRLDPSHLIIGLCWATLFLVWVVSAPFAKRTLERSLGWPRLVAFAALLAMASGALRATGLHRRLWQATPALEA